MTARKTASETDSMVYCKRSKGYFPTERAHQNEFHLKLYPECALNPGVSGEGDS